MKTLTTIAILALCTGCAFAPFAARHIESPHSIVFSGKTPKVLHAHGLDGTHRYVLLFQALQHKIMRDEDGNYIVTHRRVHPFLEDWNSAGSYPLEYRGPYGPY